MPCATASDRALATFRRGSGDTGAKGWKHIAEQQTDQLLAGRRGPILRDFRDERIGGGEHKSNSCKST